jgi:hypothetical protein
MPDRRAGPNQRQYSQDVQRWDVQHSLAIKRAWAASLFDFREHGAGVIRIARIERPVE